MKKRVIVFLLIILIITGCKKAEKVKQFDITMELDSSIGEVNNIEIDNDDIVSVERIYKPGECNDASKCAGTEIYRLSSLKSGKTKITLIKNNSDGKVVKKVQYTITVDKDLYIKEKHKKIK